MRKLVQGPILFTEHGQHGWVSRSKGLGDGSCQLQGEPLNMFNMLLAKCGTPTRQQWRKGDRALGGGVTGDTCGHWIPGTANW